MSTELSKKYEFNCWNDHSQTESCNGHTLQISWHHTSDTVSVYIDGDSRLCVDQGTWNVLEQAIREQNQKRDGKQHLRDFVTPDEFIAQLKEMRAAYNSPTDELRAKAKRVRTELEDYARAVKNAFGLEMDQYDFVRTMVILSCLEAALEARA